MLMGIDFRPPFWARDVLNHFLCVTASAHPAAPAGRAWRWGRGGEGGAAPAPGREDGPAGTSRWCGERARPGRLRVMEPRLKTMLSPLLRALMDATDDVCEMCPRLSRAEVGPSAGRRFQQTGRRWQRLPPARPSAKRVLAQDEEERGRRSPQGEAGGRALIRCDSLARCPRRSSSAKCSQSAPIIYLWDLSVSSWLTRRVRGVARRAFSPSRAG